VAAHQPAQRRLLVRRVVVDVHVRVALELLDREVGEALKCEPLPSLVVAPPGVILTAHVDRAEEILERHIARETVALHVEEDIRRVMGSERAQTVPNFPGIEQFVSRDTSACGPGAAVPPVHGGRGSS